MSNYPMGAEHDPRAPWNQSDYELPHNLVSEVRGIIAERMSELIYDAMYEAGVSEFDQDAVYDEIYSDARKIWERDI